MVRKEAASAGRAFLNLESGDFLFPEEPLFPEEFEQRRVKAELILAANKAIGVDFAAVGDQDLKLGVEFLKTAAQQHQFPFYSANLLTSDGKPVFPGHVVKTIGGVKVGLFSVITMTTGFDAKPLFEDNPSYKVTDPFVAARAEVAALQAEGAQVIVAVTHLGLTDDMRLANDVPGIHFVFGGHSSSQLNEPNKAGTTWVLQSGSRGKYIGRLDIDLKGEMPGALATLTDVSSQDKLQERIKHYESEVQTLKARLENEPDVDRKTMIQDQVDFYTEQLAIESKKLPADPKAASSLKNEIVALSRDVADEPTVSALVAAALDKIAALPPPPAVQGLESAAGPASGPYVGATVCAGCHVPQANQWRTTGHAKAFKTLQEENHAVDFDCVACHTTGYRKDGGPKDPFTTAGFHAVQCEACHGPGRAHANDPKKVKLVKTFDEAFCRTCHSVEQTADRFVFSEYLPKVAHPNPPAAAEK